MRVIAYAAIALSVSGCGVLEERDATTARTPSASVRTAPTQTPAGPAVSDGSPMDAQLSIPQIGIDGLEVIAYTGKTDDGPGTEIQNNGLAASPSGPEGGVGPGGVGNYQVTAHRLSSTQAFLRLPELRSGDRVDVVAGDRRYVYEIVQTRETSFRSEASLRAQRAGVPGKPGAKPVAAYITLSTCATPEDHAAGNYWADEFGNPEHRIDKIGRLVASEPVQARR
jgi:sortase A